MCSSSNNVDAEKEIGSPEDEQPENFHAQEKEIVSKGKEIASEENEQPKSYKCAICGKTFSTPMALGGHQNGHKSQRAKAKQQAKNSFCGLTLLGSLLGLGSGFTQPLNHWFFEKPPRVCAYDQACATHSSPTSSCMNNSFNPESKTLDFFAIPDGTTANFSGVQDFFFKTETYSSAAQIGCREQDGDAQEFDLNLKL